MNPIVAKLLPVLKSFGKKLYTLLLGSLLLTTSDNPLTAEAVLACLDLLTTKWSYRIDDTTLIVIVAYSDSSNSWATEMSSQVASRLLETHLSPERLSNFVTRSILHTFLRPLFARSSTRVTASGRPSYYQGPMPQPYQGIQTPAWRQECPWAAAVFHWAVKASDVS